MLDVCCANCGTFFRVGDESAGGREYRPHCGVLTDVPADGEAPVASDLAPESESAFVPTALSASTFAVLTDESPKQKRGIPIVLWWGLILLAAGGFGWGVAMLTLNDWEQQHMQGIVDSIRQADAALAEGNFSEAKQKYQSAIDTTAGHTLQSNAFKGWIAHAAVQLPISANDAQLHERITAAEMVLRGSRLKEAIASFDRILSQANALPPDDPIAGELDRVRRERADAQMRLAALAAAPLAASRSTVASAVTTKPTAAETDQIARDAVYTAVRNFQRSCEGFAQFVLDRPDLFQDDQHQWRRRQYTVWDLTYEWQPAQVPPQMLLKYSCNSRTTDAHDEQQDAKDDTSFIHEDHVQPIHCQTLFALKNQTWIVLWRQQDQDPQSGSIRRGLISSGELATLSDLYKLEARAFHAKELHSGGQ